MEKEKLGDVTLTAAQVDKFRDAILGDYFFEMHIDDMPVWGYVGRHVSTNVFSNEESSRCFLFTHFDFSIGYNGPHVVEVNISADPTRQVEMTSKKGVTLEFTYGATWHARNITYEHRMDRYYGQPHTLGHELEIHWIGIINSFIFVVSLTTVLGYILLHILRRDYQKIEEDDEAAEDAGWKLLHGDVFRYPPHPSILSALLGVGTQIFVLVLLLLILAVLGVFYPANRGSIYVAGIVCYSLTACIAGFVSARWYTSLQGTRWARNTLLTACLITGPTVIIFCILNTIALAYGSNAALPFSTIFVIALIGLTVTLPLTILGGITGKNFSKPFDAPCRTRHVPGLIPNVPWYRRAIPQIIMAGFLPFSSIYIELYYVYSSLWGHHMYSLFGILLLVFLILTIVTAFVTIMHVYFQLSAEDYRWWWRSFLYGGSTGLFMYAYCFTFYFSRSNMSGALQTAYFFGYMALICYGFSLMLGAVGFFSAMFFVKKIYQVVKSD